MGALLLFLQNLCAKYPNYIATLGITAAEQSFLNLMCSMCETLNNFQNQAKRFAQDWTALRKSCMGPTPGSVPVWPVWPGPATAPVGLERGCGKKLRDIIKRWKTQPGYNDDIGEDLGILGDEITPPDPETVQPELEVNIVAGRPQLSAELDGFESVEFEVDRGSGFGLLDVSTGAPVTDDHPLPPAGQSAVWTYRGVLRDKDNERVGNFSLSVPVPVVGI